MCVSHRHFGVNKTFHYKRLGPGTVPAAHGTLARLAIIAYNRIIAD
jgi:hypothetical protein